MNPPGYDINHQWNGPRDIFTRQQFAAVIRDVSGIDTWYSVCYLHDDEILITGFRIAGEWQGDMNKYGYYWELEINNHPTIRQGTVSDIWTAKVRLCEYLGCTDQEINDIFWNGKSRDLVGCSGCPCNRVEGEGKR